MKRELNLEEVSDGKLYGENELVKADCGGCRDCHSCCTGMGKTVILDPYDVYLLKCGEGKDLAGYLQEESIELSVADGLILPNLKMDKEGEVCPFLNEKGRCSIHAYRPGICRIFPLGRIYEADDYRYFLQVHECPVPHKTKVKPSQWIGIPENTRYHRYLCAFYQLKKALEERIDPSDAEEHKRLTMQFLQLFYLLPYQPETDFYTQFDERKEKWEEMSQ